MNKEISVYDNSISARTYLSYIAEQAGGIAIIGRDGKLYIKTFGESVVELSLNRFKDFKWGEKFKITRVYYEDGIQRFEQGDTTENTVYISQDNMYIVDQEQIDNIYNKVKDLEVYSFEGTTIIDPAIDIGDILLIDGKKVIYQGSSEYSGHFIASISSKIQCKAKEETTTRTTSQTAINRRVQSQINQAEGKITMLSSSIETANNTANEALNNTNVINTTEEAKEFYLTDSANSNCKSVEIFGESKQETRSGKNLLPNSATTVTSNGVTFTVNLDGSIHIVGTSTARTLFNINVTKPITLKETSYVLSKFGDNEFVEVYLRKSNVSDLITSMAASQAVKQFNNIYTEPVFAYIAINANKTVDVTIKLQLEEGTEATAYEPYGAMPSPEFPSEIENVSGKNLAIYNEFTTLRDYANACPNNSVEEKKIWDIYNSLPKDIQLVANWNFESDGTAIANISNNRITINYSDNSCLTTEKGKPFTIDGSKTLSSIIIYGNQNATSTIFSNFQVEKGIVPTFYVPYNNIGFKSTGKNLYNVNNPKTTPSSITVDEDGWITCNYDNTDGTSEIYINYYTSNLELKTGTPYNIITEVKEFSGKCSLIVVDRWGQFGVGKAYNTSNLKPNSIYTYVGTTKDEYTGNVGLATSIGLGAGSSISITFRISVIEDTSVTADTFLYEPYKESITSIPLLHDLRSLPNGTRDRIYCENGKWYDEQNVGRVVLDGDENWTKFSSGSNNKSVFNSINISNNIGTVLADTDTAISNYFKQSYVDNTYGDVGNFMLWSATNGSIRIAFNDDDTTTLDDFKTWLSTHNTEVLYELAEPIITEITDEETIKALESIKTYKGITNITSDANSILTYYRDVPMVEEYETIANANKKYKITTEKFAEQEITNTSIKSSVTEVNTKISNDLATKNELSTEIAQVNNAVDIKIEEKEARIQEVDGKINTLSEKVTNMNYSFGTQGLRVATNKDANNSLLDNSGIRVYNYNDLQAIFNYKGSGIDKLIVTGTAQIGYLRAVKSTKNGEPVTKVFHLKNLIEDLKDLEV